MRVAVRTVACEADERVVLECVRMSEEFADIRDYVLARGSRLSAFLDGREQQIALRDVLYFEAVGDLVFAYTADRVYGVKRRLYEVEADYARRKFVRAAKSLVVNLLQVESFRPGLNGRLCARMRNGEDIIVSRQYAKAVKQAIIGG